MVAFKKQHAVMKIRNEIIRATYEFFNENGFTKIDPPILTASAPEGTSELFHTKYFDEDAFLSQSGQLYMEAAAMAHGRVFSFGPTFRAEKSKTRRHLIEFWMIEPEMAFTNHVESLEVQEQYVSHVVKSVLNNCQLELKALDRDTSKLEKVSPFPRISYDDAIKFLKEEGFDDIEWGEDLVHHMKLLLQIIMIYLYLLQIIQLKLNHSICNQIQRMKKQFYVQI